MQSWVPRAPHVELSINKISTEGWSARAARGYYCFVQSPIIWRKGYQRWQRSTITELALHFLTSNMAQISRFNHIYRSKIKSFASLEYWTGYDGFCVLLLVTIFFCKSCGQKHDHAPLKQYIQLCKLDISLSILSYFEVVWKCGGKGDGFGDSQIRLQLVFDGVLINIEPHTMINPNRTFGTR